MNLNSFSTIPAAMLALAALALAATASAASLTVEFKPKDGEPTPFEEVNVLLIPPGVRSIDGAIRHTAKEKAFTKTFEDLEPGGYMLLVFTGSYEQTSDGSRPGAFNFQKAASLPQADSHETVLVEYAAFDPDSIKGDADAGGTIVASDDQPFANQEIQISAFVQTAGLVVVAETKTDEQGAFNVSNLSRELRYMISDSEGNRLGQLNPGQPNSIRLAPRVGSVAPNISFIHLDSGETQQLSDFKGKIVVVDFWASWCGPCQEPMSKMQTYAEKNPHWGDKVTLMALSIDATQQAASNHLKKNGWNKSYNTWAGEGAGQAEAPRKFAVQGIPQVFIIDQNGKITDAGHPSQIDIPARINQLLETN